MKRSGNYSQLWVKLAIGGGILLGLLLLIQTIATYFYVYDKIVHEETAREVERKEATLLRTAASARVSDPKQFGAIIAELQKEAPKQIAWIRIINMNSQVVAETGHALTAVPTPEELRHQLQIHQSKREEIKSQSGEILVVDSRMRLFGPRREGPPPPTMEPPPNGFPGPGGPRDAAFSEIAIYVDGVTVNFGALRENLIVGCLAALALLASMLTIGLLFNRYIRARQLEQQLELARSVQTDLLPTGKNKQTTQNLDFAAGFFPAATVGGDFYDVFTAPDGPVSVVLGDVAGKGISAALLMGVLHGAIRSISWTKSAADQEEATSWLNRFLCEKTARERFVSLFWAYFLPDTGVLRYVNAGHLPPLLVRANPKDKPAVEKLESGGPVLGLLPLASYASGLTDVEEGDVLVVFSDGVAEATNRIDEEFGEERIAAIVKANISRAPQVICDLILNAVTEFLGDLKAHDDQTLLVVRLAPAKKASDEAEVPDSASVVS